MASLQHSKIYRAGVTAQNLNFETGDCTFYVNTADSTVDFRFRLASKGGGKISVLLQIGREDLPAVLTSIAEEMPETVGTLAECAAIANRKVLELLKEAQRVKGDEKARAKGMIDKLEKVEEFVSEKYYEAPAGKDEKEAEAQRVMSEVITTLRALT